MKNNVLPVETKKLTTVLLAKAPVVITLSIGSFFGDKEVLSPNSYFEFDPKLSKY